MPSTYDAMYDSAARAEDYIAQAFEDEAWGAVQKFINQLYSASEDFQSVADDWKAIAEKYENKLVDMGVI